VSKAIIATCIKPTAFRHQQQEEVQSDDNRFVPLLQMAILEVVPES
jgi:hypothetical protein